MADIIITRRRDVAFLNPVSMKGKRWLMANKVTAYGSTFTIQLEFLEETIKELDRDGINYEEL